MVSIKEAAENAKSFAQAALGPERTRGIRLEEVESTTIAGEDTWLITLSMVLPPEDDPMGAAAAILGKPKRTYRTFTVIKRDGEVTSMKIRELADA